MSRYLDAFIEESLEYLQNLNEYILELEKNPEDKETINAIFRVAHTLKGMSGSMGFTDMGELTHNMENIFDKFKNGELSVTTEVINALFKCLDALEKIVDNIQNGSNDKVDTEELILMLKKLENTDVQEEAETEEKNTLISQNYDELDEYEKNIVKEAIQRDYYVYKVYVEIYKDTLLKSARAYLVYKTLEEAGEIVKAVPPIEELEQEKFDISILSDFSFIFSFILSVLEFCVYALTTLLTLIPIFIIPLSETIFLSRYVIVYPGKNFTVTL